MALARGGGRGGYPSHRAAACSGIPNAPPYALQRRCIYEDARYEDARYEGARYTESLVENNAHGVYGIYGICVSGTCECGFGSWDEETPPENLKEFNLNSTHVYGNMN